MAERLPAWSECEAACDDLTATPLQKFIYNYEPGDNDNEWRRDLLDALTATKHDLAVKMLVVIENLPTIINREGVKKGGDLNGWYSAQQGAIKELGRLFAAEGIDLAPLTARKEKEGE